jgi:branched-subunit amino acid aminotransferase/4-amino-4-deoxychorismate lyase
MIWVAGRIVPDEELKVSVLDRTFEHGLGLFETLRTWDGRAVLLGRHLDRLRRSAKELGLPIDPASLPDADAVAELLRANHIEGDALLRITLTGSLSDSESSTLWMRSAPLPPPMGEKGATVALGFWEASWSDPLARHKTLNYWLRRMASERGREAGFDEVLSWTPDASHWEGTRTNLFIIRGDELITPTTAGPIVPGVMRDVVLERAADIPLTVTEDGEITDLTVMAADEIFLTNAVRGIIPVARTSVLAGQCGIRWKGGAPGSWTQRLSILISDWLMQGGPIA